MNKNVPSNNLLLNLGFDQFNEMQIAAQEAILEENNVLLLSPTGSGKTVAFLVPIFEMLLPEIHIVLYIARKKDEIKEDTNTHKGTQIEMKKNTREAKNKEIKEETRSHRGTQKKKRKE